jgi:hypothetical protein
MLLKNILAPVIETCEKHFNDNANDKLARASFTEGWQSTHWVEKDYF